jgi:hypothetical protein
MGFLDCIRVTALYFLWTFLTSLAFIVFICTIGSVILLRLLQNDCMSHLATSFDYYTFVEKLPECSLYNLTFGSSPTYESFVKDSIPFEDVLYLLFTRK